MSSEHDAATPIIVARNLTKTYRIYARPHHRLLQAIRRSSKYATDFSALKDVSLEVMRGETVGIVGRNGSGKSTLLQIICGIITPTSGEITVRGRIAAILELGAGFNPEFTGRENVILGASLLGLTPRETSDAMEGIIDFSELGEFVDQPVKTYSSGMYIRLAFSLAISAIPDILVIDEALAVGDEAFQRKCFAKIEQLKAGGCTLLFVSHSAGTVIHLCDRVILMDHGRRLLSGRPKKVVGYYQKLIYASAQKRDAVLQEIAELDRTAPSSEPEMLPLDLDEAPQIVLHDLDGSERFDQGMVPASTVTFTQRGALIEPPAILSVTGERVNVLTPNAQYRIVYRVHFEDDARLINFGMMIKSLEGIELFGMTSSATGDAIDFVAAGSIYEVEFIFQSRFLPGTYFLNVGCHGVCNDGEIGFLHRILDAGMFKVEQTASDRLVRGFFDLSEEPACRLRVER